MGDKNCLIGQAKIGNYKWLVITSPNFRGKLLGATCVEISRRLLLLLYSVHYCFFLGTSSDRIFLDRVHETLLHFIKNDGADDQNEGNKNTAPENIQKIETARP